MDDSIFIEVEHVHCNKKEQLCCGDVFASRKLPAENRLLTVLSDGLGSGVKANILANMTATMALKFIASGADILPSSRIIMDALPVCQTRRISYATFTIVDAYTEGPTRIINMGNPPFLLIRDGAVVETTPREVSSPGWKNRIVELSTITIRPEDRIIVFSDGISQAGQGTDRYPFGWRVRGVREFILQQIAKNPTISARRLAEDIVLKALQFEEDHRPGDDMSAVVQYFRKPRRMLVMTGPPFAKERDAETARFLDRFQGRTAICGGTTANIVARELGRDVETELPRSANPLPPISHVKGVDLVTEGILTLTAAVRILEEGRPAQQESAATKLVDLLRESDIVHFCVGTRINEAHQDPNLPIELEIRRNIAKRMARVLEDKYMKEIHVQYV